MTHLEQKTSTIVEFVRKYETCPKLEICTKKSNELNDIVDQCY